MNRTWLALSAFFILAAPACAREKRPPRPVVVKMRRVPVPRPRPIKDPGHIVNDNRQVPWPKQNEQGKKIKNPPAKKPPPNHAFIARNGTIVGAIERQRGVEIERNKYHWHVVKNVRYCHYFDDAQIHWYGFYFGPTFYWTRLFANRWWWYDPQFARWVYWHEGYWWWPGPSGAQFVYVDNNYYPYEEASGAVTVQNPQPAQSAPKAPASATDGSVFISSDGARMVQIFGPRSEAFLYDESFDQPVFLKYLARDVERVRFSNSAADQSLLILLEFKDGDFSVFDAAGNSVDPRPAPALPEPPTVSTSTLTVPLPPAQSPPGQGKPPPQPPE